MPEPGTNPARTLQRFTSHREQEQATRRYWQSRTVAEKMQETANLIRYAYSLRGIDIDAERPTRVIKRIQPPQG